MRKHYNITGQCLEALILGVMFFIAMSIFKMPYVLLISVFISVTALIPVVGAWLGCFVGVLLILMVNPMQALGFGIMFIVIQQLEGNLIYPKVVGSRVGLPPLWVLAAVILGGGLFGVAGLVLGIPAVIVFAMVTGASASVCRAASVLHTMQGEVNRMEDALGLTTALNTLAVTVACRLEDEELALLAASLVQLGDTLATIAAQRALEKRCQRES